jgi:hypothetical protein
MASKCTCEKPMFGPVVKCLSCTATRQCECGEPLAPRQRKCELCKLMGGGGNGGPRSKMGYLGVVKGINTCLVCNMPQTIWGATKAQVEASRLIQGLADNWLVLNTPGSATERLINEAVKAISEGQANICQCAQGQKCACDYLQTMCRACTTRMGWCKCGGFGPNGARGTCIFCRTNVQPWMFAQQNGPQEFTPAAREYNKYF